MNNNIDDELNSIDLEISQVEKEIDCLRRKRSQLIERKEKLNNSHKKNQQIALHNNLIEQWQCTGKSNKFIIYFNYSSSLLDFPWSLKVNQIRIETFKIQAFRQWQLETINVTLSDLDCILIMPTGGGKSLCYQLPAILSDGKRNYFVFKNFNLV